eukprot:5259512-Amphidinium_carterae.1
MIELAPDRHIDCSSIVAEDEDQEEDDLPPPVSIAAAGRVISPLPANFHEKVDTVWMCKVQPKTRNRKMIHCVSIPAESFRAVSRSFFYSLTIKCQR